MMMVSTIKTSTMQFSCSTFNCADADERGHADSRSRPSMSWDRSGRRARRDQSVATPTIQLAWWKGKSAFARVRRPHEAAGHGSGMLQSHTAFQTRNLQNFVHACNSRPKRRRLEVESEDFVHIHQGEPR